MRMWTVLILAAVVSGVVGLSACGGDDDGSGESGGLESGACVDQIGDLTPQVVDCDSPEAKGILEEVESPGECGGAPEISELSTGDEGIKTFCVHRHF